MLVEKAIESYINWKAVYSPHAASRYLPRLQKLFAFTSAIEQVEDLTGDDINRFHKQMEVQNYSRATIAYSLTVIKNFLQFWKNRGLSVADPKEIKSIVFTNRVKSIVTELDFQKMSDALDEDNELELRIKLCIHLLWDTGMRVSELIDLNLSDMNEENEKGIRTAQILSKKSARYNLVAWNAETNRLLTKYIASRMNSLIQTDALLVNMMSRRQVRINTRTVQRWVRIAAMKAGIVKPITPHSFRHGKAHCMLNHGANIRDVQAILRHVNPVTTFHYLSLNEKHFLEVAGQHLRAA